MPLRLAEITTWEDLLEALKKCSKQQLKQPVQVVKSHPVDDYVYALQPGIALGTVGKLGLKYARSVTDNRMHPEHLVIFTDGNPFGIDGAVGYEVLGSLFEKRPIYGKNHDDSRDWTGPAQRLVKKKNREKTKRNRTGLLLKHRHADEK